MGFKKSTLNFLMLIDILPYLMAEHRKGLTAYWKQRDRRKRDLDYPSLQDELPIPDTSFQGPGVVNPSLITETLTYRLQRAGISDPQVISHADIYEKALVDLGQLLNHKRLSAQLKDSAIAELNSLIQGLTDLFGNRIRLRIKQLEDHVEFGGYRDDFLGLDRIGVFQKLAPSYSLVATHITNPNCQIHIQRVIRQSPRGSAIPESDAKIRCGLRYPGSIGGHCWNVSIDSGLRHGADEKSNWKIIQPLSQAIYQIQTFESFDYGEPHDYTYHYADMATWQENPIQTQESFNEFNFALSFVFRQMVRR